MSYAGTKIGADGRRYTSGQEPTDAADYRSTLHADDQSGVGVTGVMLTYTNIPTPSGYTELDWSTHSDRQENGTGLPEPVDGELTSLLLPEGVWAVQVKHQAISVNNANGSTDIWINFYPWADSPTGLYTSVGQMEIMEEASMTAPASHQYRANVIIPSDGTIKLSVGMSISALAADFPNFGDLVVGIFKLS